MMLDDRSEDLIQRYLEHVATPAELAELDRLVSKRFEVADALWEAARVDTLLTLHLQGIASAETATVGYEASGFLRRRTVQAIAAAAAVLVVAAVLWWSLRGPTAQVAEDAVPSDPNGISRYNMMGHPVLAGAVEVDGTPSTRVFDDAPLRVVGDRPAVIELAGGTRAELAVSTAAVIRRSDNRAEQILELLEGGGRFRVPQHGNRPFNPWT